jgi:asparagine synthase (glutamine-hydrolysing)
MDICSINVSTAGWSSRNGCYVKGFVFYENKILQGVELVNTFLLCDTEQEFKQRLVAFNGQFSVIIVKGDFVWLAVDKIRHFPLFYTKKAGESVIADNTKGLSDTSKKLNEIAVKAFLMCGYCLGQNTLLQDVFQVEAGQYIVLTANRVDKINYFHYFGVTKKWLSYADAGEQLKTILNDVIVDYLQLCQGRTIIVTLSGGFDSRLLLTLLKKHHYQKVLAVTYGRKKMPEIAVARKVASSLNIEWINIEYDGIVQKDMLTDENFLEYYQYAANDASMFYLQDYFAIKRLKESGVLDKCDRPVFMPGYSGDFLAGSHLSIGLNTKKFDKSLLIKTIRKEYFYYFNLPLQENEMCFDDKVDTASELPWTNFENWVTKERQAKFIVNSGKVFHFFGCDYVTPLWDDRLQYFFRDLPFEWKYEQKLYKEVLREFLFKPADILFPEDMVSMHRNKIWQNFKNEIKQLLPKKFVNKFTDNGDWYCYAEVIALMRQEKKHPNFIIPRQVNYHNAYLSQWYLMKEYGWDGKLK